MTMSRNLLCAKSTKKHEENVAIQSNSKWMSNQYSNIPTVLFNKFPIQCKKGCDKHWLKYVNC